MCGIEIVHWFSLHACCLQFFNWFFNTNSQEYHWIVKQFDPDLSWKFVGPDLYTNFFKRWNLTFSILMNSFIWLGTEEYVVTRFTYQGVTDQKLQNNYLHAV